MWRDAGKKQAQAEAARVGAKAFEERHKQRQSSDERWSGPVCRTGRICVLGHSTDLVSPILVWIRGAWLYTARIKCAASGRGSR